MDKSKSNIPTIPYSPKISPNVKSYWEKKNLPTGPTNKPQPSFIFGIK